MYYSVRQRHILGTNFSVYDFAINDTLNGRDNETVSQLVHQWGIV